MDSLSADIVTLNQKVLYIALDQAAIKINKGIKIIPPREYTGL